MEQNENSESWDDADAPPPRRRRRRPGETVISSADWEPTPWEDTPAGKRGGPSPHLKPGEKSWVEVEQARRRKGEAPLSHEIPPPEEFKPTGTGFFYKSGREIPPTHPDHGPMHLVPRQEDGSFAAYYYCSKEELEGLPAPPPRRHRRDGFSFDRQDTFIQNLRNCGSITDAARLTGISRTAVYNLLNSPDADAFRDAVSEALKGMDVLLEATAFERAIHGQEEIVYYEGRRVGVRWKYDNRLLMSLLRARNPLKYAPLTELEGWLKLRGVEPAADVEGALDRLAAAEADWGRRLPGEDLLGRPALSSPVSQASISSTSPAGADLVQASTSSTSPAPARRSTRPKQAKALIGKSNSARPHAAKSVMPVSDS